MEKLNIGKQIKYYREKQNLTQEELADKIGVSGEMISRYERDIHMPYQKIISIADALNIQPEKLFKSEEENIVKPYYEIPLFTKIPKNYEFKKEKTSFFYTCPKWMYEKDINLFAIDGDLIEETNGIYYISPNIYPYKKHTVLAVKDDLLVIDNFKNQKKMIGVVIAQEKKFV